RNDSSYRGERAQEAVSRVVLRTRVLLSSLGSGYNQKSLRRDWPSITHQTSQPARLHALPSFPRTDLSSPRPPTTDHGNNNDHHHATQGSLERCHALLPCARILPVCRAATTTTTSHHAERPATPRRAA
ncbi:hypothetical protein BC567DRAFT_216952, partial [Phyllosticta citribraziliensis]